MAFMTANGKRTNTYHTSATTHDKPGLVSKENKKEDITHIPCCADNSYNCFLQASNIVILIEFLNASVVSLHFKMVEVHEPQAISAMRFHIVAQMAVQAAPSHSLIDSVDKDHLLMAYKGSTVRTGGELNCCSAHIQKSQQTDLLDESIKC